jgi:hypothetical protein
MTEARVSKILFLRVPDADADFGKHIASGISADGVAHEFVDVGPDTYDSILDRLEVGVLPVVLKPAGP